jgi:S-adenosylhomocysteine hydrolase
VVEVVEAVEAVEDTRRYRILQLNDTTKITTIMITTIKNQKIIRLE